VNVGSIAGFDNESTTTSELLQAHLPTSKVVKAFNHIYAAALTTDGQPAGTKNRRALVIAGDDQGAKSTVTRLLDQFGFDTVDAGAVEGRMAYPARYTRLRSASYGAGAAQRPRGGQAVRRPLAVKRSGALRVASLVGSLNSRLFQTWVLSQKFLNGRAGSATMQLLRRPTNRIAALDAIWHGPSVGLCGSCA
jgi:hypothetical protein